MCLEHAGEWWSWQTTTQRRQPTPVPPDAEGNRYLAIQSCAQKNGKGPLGTDHFRETAGGR